MYVARLASARLNTLARRFPCVAVLGPRQCGKTTLVKEWFMGGESFDLEKPSDLTRLQFDPEYTLRNAKPPVILDEIQRMPEIFPILRALVDERRNARRRFVLLGSAHPTLVRGISESLAGRIGFLDLSPFCYVEVAPHKISLSDLWLRGGFPEPSLRGPRWEPVDWMDGYIRTFIERDLGGLAPDISASNIRRFWQMLAAANGTTWNASNFARDLGISYHTVDRYAGILQGTYLLRLLQPYHTNIKKRLVKRPKLYLTDSGLLHAFLGVYTKKQLDTAPGRGLSWEGFLIEQIVRRERLAYPASEFFYWGTATGAEVDLIVNRGQEKIGIEFKLGTHISPSDWKWLRQAVEDIGLARAYVVNQTEKAYSPFAGLQVVPAAQLLNQTKWML